MSTLRLGKSRFVNQNFLDTLPDPAPMGRFHRPLRFADVVSTLKQVFNPTSISLGLNPSNTRLFGLMDNDKGSIGFRSSVDESMALKIAVGVHVMVCDNMILSGEETLLNRHHTTKFNFLESLLSVLPNIEKNCIDFQNRYDVLKYEYLTDQEASYLMVDAIRRGAFPANDMKKVADLYFGDQQSPESVDSPFTKFSLLQAFTRVMKDHPVQARYGRTVAIGQIMGI